jgi:FAD-dependent oxidoreductase domain-containing protein 1
MPEKTDVLVIGGGAIGASVAYFVKRLDPGVEVTVVERDPAYTLASTPRASGGVRRLFSLPENIALSTYSIGFFEDFPAAMTADGAPADIGLRQNGTCSSSPRRTATCCAAISMSSRSSAARSCGSSPRS